jgi:hypothetical protein
MHIHTHTLTKRGVEMGGGESKDFIEIQRISLSDEEHTETT